MLNNKISKAVRLAIAFGAASTAVLASTAVSAEENTEEVERIQITGSKIKRIAATAPTPVVVIGRVELENAGVSNVNDFLSEMPAAEVGLSPENSNNYIYANGLNTTDLRGLGSSRTLVLVNGRRFIGGSAGDNTVDLNNIATSMIERIEISTGGASAVYGADAVAGVVNIITRKSFDGIEIDAATTRPFEGGGEQTFGSLVFGKEFDGGGFIFNYDFADQKQMAKKDKSWWYDNPVSLVPNPNNKNGDDGVPSEIKYEGRKHFGLYDESSEFVLGGKRWTFDENKNLREFDVGSGYLPSDPDAGTYRYYPGEYKDGIEEGLDEFFRTPLTRHTFNLAGNYEINENHKLTFDTIYSISEAFGQGSPVFWRTGDIVIRKDNAFIKDDLRQLMEENNAETISLRRLGDDFGSRKYNQDRTTFRTSIGLDGYIDDNWSYSTYFQHSRLQQDTSWHGEVLKNNFQNALDAVERNGEIVCAQRDDDGNVVGSIFGCSPINVLGAPGHSQETIDYISTVATAEHGATQTSFGATITGDVYELPAGPIGTAFSFEWRRDSAYETPGTGIRKDLVFGNSGLAYSGAVNVKEYATEVIIPLIADHEWAQELNLELAYRYMDYSSTGGDSAYKVGLTYQLNDDIRFRATKAESVRAPNVNELYSAAGTQYWSRGRFDQCAADEIAKTDDKYRDNVVKNCAAAGIPAGWMPSQQWLDSGSIEGKLGGNNQLDNEVSSDVVFGFVYTPTSIEGFDITVDYWSFEIENAIEDYDYGELQRNCYRADSLDNPFCGFITRGANNEVTSFFQTSLNAAEEKKSGVDIESVYDFETSIGEFGVKLTATYVENYEINQTGNPIDLLVKTGEQDHMRWRGRLNTSYEYGDFRAVLVANYRHSAVNERNGWTIEQHNYNDIPSYTTFDLSMNYRVLENVDLRFGIQNMFDRTPPRHPLAFEDTSWYDPIGRRATVGVNIKL
ncbi:TonB-dependent receptor [Pseudoalteromonas sp. CO348]|uniref:TonB-dependent receptor plug domain-containing protein n=1 Tax=unclassified Pseudoalteromonas TaxID=194690 RepID=UPI001022DE83|nr:MULTISPECIES: TonB-dependent receptor [unclassified Pseudoalteromonas]MCG7538304.1 TonB-dependent receptor [Pseudoalteromonas sp. OF7H-1]RZG08295.1 TonB-dependent receptor [Pseudoalteromonas sp. CO348]